VFEYGSGLCAALHARGVTRLGSNKHFFSLARREQE
jgi:hypothetical protein